MSPAPFVYTRQATASDLLAVVDAFRSDLAYLYFESEAEIELVAYQAPDASWLHGRAFGPRLEIRWDRGGDGFDLILLTEEDGPWPAGWEPVLPGDPELICPDSVDAEGQVLLWGTHVSQLDRPHNLEGSEADAWIETRIPRPLHYPVSGAPRWVKARTRVYRHRGEPVLTRLMTLEGEDDEPRPL